MRARRLASLLLLSLVAACAVPVAGGLDESDANRIVLALDRANIDATKEGDPGAEGKYRVLVTRDDAQRALATMQAEALPRPHAAGVLDAVEKGALVPSQAQEHAELVAGMAGDLERTLLGVDGVLAARVHLNLVAPDPLRDGPVPRATASVLVEHRGSTPPLTSEAIGRLVAFGAPGLSPQDVAVVLVPRAAIAASGDAQLSHVGPIAVARSSMRILQTALVSLTALVALLAMATLFLYSRVRRLRDEAAVAAGPAARRT
jgi:type III secretion protein J